MGNCDAWYAIGCHVWIGTPAIACAGAALTAALSEAPAVAHRRRPHLAVLLFGLAALAFTAAGAFGGLMLPLESTLTFAGALALAAAGTWALRPVRGGADDDDGGGGGGSDGRDPPDDPPGGIEWDEFEREFWAYADAQRAVRAHRELVARWGGP